jgi:hypothetical protein
MELQAMSMNFSEFKRLLGAEPRSGDPELQRARHSSPEFEEAALNAERFETKLERCVSIPAPDGLIEGIMAISQQQPDSTKSKGWWPMALAASVLLAVGAAGLTWKMNPRWDSVEDYLAYHYRHDGEKLLSRADGASANDVQALLSELNVRATPALAGIVGMIKYCPTPDGKGVHMILNTETGPVTVFYMPDTEVTDKEMLAFDNMEAILVDLQSGSAAIIGPDMQLISSLYNFVQDSILPAPGNS